MNHDNATFEIHVHGDIPIKPGTDAKALQEALKPLWHYAGARSLREGGLSLYEESPACSSTRTTTACACAGRCGAKTISVRCSMSCA